MGDVLCPLALLCAQVLLGEDRSGMEVGDPGALQTDPPDTLSQRIMARATRTGVEMELLEL